MIRKIGINPTLVSLLGIMLLSISVLICRNCCAVYKRPKILTSQGYGHMPIEQRVNITESNSLRVSGLSKFIRNYKSGLCINHDRLRVQDSFTHKNYLICLDQKKK